MSGLKLHVGFDIVNIDGEFIVSKIVETEAYGGREDKACHAGRFGLTKRTAPLFGKVEFSYVYSVCIYKHFCLNVVVYKDEDAGGVLVKTLQPLSGLGVILRILGKREIRCEEIT